MSVGPGPAEPPMAAPLPGLPPALGMAAWSGTGKTTLLTRLLPLLGARGLRVGLVKHAHHDFEVDTPGKDSYELRQAGANPVLVASRRRWALMAETPEERDPGLWELVARMGPYGLDLVLVEGFKHEAFPKIELHRPALGKPLIHPQDPAVIAVACDAPLPAPPPLPLLDLNRPEGIADFIAAHLAALATRGDDEEE